MNDQPQFTFKVEVYTTGLLIIGSYDLPMYRRVSDTLNSGMYRYVTLRDATIAPLTRPQQGQHIESLLVDWSTALLVASLEEPAPPPGFAEDAAPRDLQPMMFFTSHFALRGNFFRRPDMDLAEAMQSLTDDFIPLNAVQLFPIQGGQNVTRSFACLRRDHVEALYAIGTTVKPVVPAARMPADTETSANQASPAEPAEAPPPDLPEPPDLPDQPEAPKREETS
jgi:hypothetical protein